MVGRDVTHRAEPRIESISPPPFFDRLAPAPPAADLAAQIEAWSKPGEVVIDLNGRGGWVARAAIAEQRRAADFESDPLTRLLAEVVLRPPDVRHLDAAVQGIGSAAMAGSSVRSTIDALFASRCPSCGRTVVLESLVWEASGATTRAIRREYRCNVCREQLGGPDLRHAEPEPGDLELALSVEPEGAVREALRRRFPMPNPDSPLADQLLALHTPRQLLGLHAILERIESELRAAPITAALRLALLGALLPSSRLNAYPGRLGTLRIANGVLKPPSGSQWRERNPWLAFEDAYRTVRGFVQRLEAAAQRVGFARFGPDLLAIEEGTANVALAEATPGAMRRLAVQGERIANSGTPSRIRLALGQPPLRWTPERLAAAYHGTAWVLGPDAAGVLPLATLFGPAAKPPLEADAVALGRSLAVVAPALAASAHAVVLFDGAAPEALLAGILGAEAAGYRLIDAQVHRHGDDGSASLAVFVPPGGVLAPGPRTRANRPLPPSEGGMGDPRTIPGRGLFGAPERLDEGPYRPAVAAQVVTEVAVELLQARGEPATYDQLLGDILVGLDRSGQLARLAARWRHAVATDRPGWLTGEPADGGGHESRAPEAPEDADAGGGPEGSASGRIDRIDGAGTRSSAPSPQARDSEPEPIGALLSLIRAELDRPANRRLCQIEPGQYWLGSEEDRAAASAPLADRVEWAVFGLLSATRQLSEAAFFDRMAAMFRQRDAPDEALLRACLDSYRVAGGSPDEIVCSEQLERRSGEHDATIARLAEVGHRLGFHVWIGRRQQSRRVGTRPLSSWLDEAERNIHLPLVARGPEEELERVDCAWYVPHKASFLFEVEWTAMLGEPVLVRHGRIPTEDRLVRFLVIPSERAELIRFKLARSPLLRQGLAEGNWHLLKWRHLAEFAEQAEPSLESLEPYLGLDATADEAGEQLPLFEG